MTREVKIDPEAMQLLQSIATNYLGNMPLNSKSWNSLVKSIVIQVSSTLNGPRNPHQVGRYFITHVEFLPYVNGPSTATLQIFWSDGTDYKGDPIFLVTVIQYRGP